MKPPKIPSVISLAILTAITLVFWVLFEVLRAFIIKPQTAVPQAITEPLNPNLDSKTIDKIQGSVFIDNSQIPQGLIPSPSPTQFPTPSPGALPTSSPSASPNPTSP